MSSPKDLSSDDLIGFLKTMVIIRHFDEKALELFSKGALAGGCQWCVGQEAVAIGTCSLLRRDDYVVSHHRGQGGSMHIADVQLGHLGANGIVGGGLPIAAGAGLSIKLRGTDQVVVAFLGDAATNIGSFHKSMNFASAFTLPVIFVCENDLYGLSTSIRYSSAEPELAAKARSYRMASEVVDGMDVLAVRGAMQGALERARHAEGPTFMECKTYRYYGHSKSDTRPYRTREEEDAWRQRDPINNLAAFLLGGGFMKPADMELLRDEAARLINEAVLFAEQSPMPDATSVEDFTYA